MKHPKIRCLVVTGGGAVVKAAMTSGKKTIGAGPGNPPVIVDDTANIRKAARGIVEGASFDNNIVCICEKEALVVASIADRLKQEMKKNEAYELNKDQIDKITKLVIAEPGKPGNEGAPNKKYVGKDAQVIAKAIGLSMKPSLARCPISQTELAFQRWPVRLMRRRRLGRRGRRWRQRIGKL